MNGLTYGMDFIRHILRLCLVMLFSVFGANMASAVPMATSDITYFQFETTHITLEDDVGFAARAPPLAAENVEVTTGVIVMRGGAFALHGQETVAADFGFEANHIATNKGVTTSIGVTVRPADSPNYSTATEVQLPGSACRGVSRQRHNQMSNQALHEAFEANPTYAAQMEYVYPGIADGVKLGPRGAYPWSSPTSDVTWHHAYQPGQMQLVPKDQHTTPGAVQDSLHPNGSGGYAGWGTE